MNLNKIRLSFARAQTPAKRRGFGFSAGWENRTPAHSLENCYSAIKLIPLRPSVALGKEGVRASVPLFRKLFITRQIVYAPVYVPELPFIPVRCWHYWDSHSCFISDTQDPVGHIRADNTNGE